MVAAIEPMVTQPVEQECCRWCGRSFASATAEPGARRCGACDVGTTSPWPTDDELDAAYGSWYRPETGRFSGVTESILRRTRSRLATRVAREAPAGPVLDVGAGAGLLVDAFQDAGREAVGLERTPSAHPSVRTGEIADAGGPWAAVIFWHTLEHLRAPRATLDDACQRLVDGGYVVVAVPNIRSLQAKAFGDRWFALDIPRHLVHLHPEALTARFEENGLTVTRTSHLGGGQVLFGWLHGLVKLVPPHLDLYDAIRKPSAQQVPMTVGQRLAAVALGVLALPIGLLATAAEVALRRGGSVLVEATRERA